MSKPNKKDKKNDTANSNLQQTYQIQKRQLLDCQYSIKKLQQRLNDITTQNIHLRARLQESNHLYNESLQEVTLKNMANQKRLLVLSNQKTKLEIENQQKQNKIKILQKNLFDQQQLRNKQFQELKKNFNFQLAKYDSQLSQYKLYMSERDQLEQERQELRQKIQIEKANKLRDIADKEKEKVQATDKLKDQMLHKINEMRKNLFSLKRQQLSTTTRLTMLQNHQLTSELQYQSKQTEKIIFKNQDLEQKINGLKQELDIHKEVEEELAKRAHFSKGIIKKLNLRINDLQGEIQHLKNQLCLPKSKKSYNESHKSSRSQSVNEDEPSKQSHTLTNNDKKHMKSLEQSLERTEKRYAELMGNYEICVKEKESLNHKLMAFDKKANELFKVMYRCYNQVFLPQVLEERRDKSSGYHLSEQFLNENIPYFYDLKNARQTPVEKWQHEDLTLTVQILLNAIQPYLLRSNLLIPAVRKNIIVNDTIATNKLEVSQSNKSLPKLLTERKEVIQKKIHQIPTNLASKIVGGNLREWGCTLKLNKTSLSRKYKLSQSYRG